MISPEVYLFILSTLFLILIVLGVAFVILVRKKASKNIEEGFKTIFPIVSPLFDNSFFWVDLGGNVIFANDSALKLLKMEKEDIPGLKLESFIKSNDTIRQIKSLRPGIPFRSVAEFISRERDVIPVELSVVSVGPLGKTIGFILIGDNLHLKEIAELKQEADRCKNDLVEEESVLGEFYLRSEAIYRIFAKALDKSEIDLHNFLKEVLPELNVALNSYMAICWIAEDGAEKFRILAHSGLSEEGIKKFIRDFSGREKILNASESGEMLIEDVSAIPSSLRVLMKEEGVVAIAGVPFFEGKKLYGVLEFYLKDGKSAEFETNKKILGQLSFILSSIFGFAKSRLSFDKDVRAIKEEGEKARENLTARLESCRQEVEELKSLQQLTIGRELKMMELKSEIEKIKGEAEQCLEEKNK